MPTLCTCLLLAIAVLPATAATAPAARPPAEHHVYQTLDEALGEVFAGADSTWTESWTPDDDARAALAAQFGAPQPPGEVVFHRARRDGRDLGWAVTTDEIGLHEPITMLVSVTAGREVGPVRVLVFRESRGGEVRRKRFLAQFLGKTRADPLRLTRDIDAVTGATYSSRAVTAGVKRVLALVDARYPLERSAP
ncbi:MAG: FMN-binding protein [Candidatus Latescibacteria bacterium]|nr:FMN-binding protein [Candidatus Latescibacterota bacterium]